MTEENIELMRERHEQEIQALEGFCEHKEISECIPYMWAIGHWSHCVKVCERCGKAMFTTRTREEYTLYMDNKPYKKCVDKIEGAHFDCPKREECTMWLRRIK